MEKELKNIRIRAHMMDSGDTISSMEKECTNGLMEICMMGIGNKEIWMGRGCIQQRMEVSMLDNGRLICRMEKENGNGQMETYIKDNYFKENAMDME
jgi:hypothetical protein